VVHRANNYADKIVSKSSFKKIRILQESQANFYGDA